MKHNKHQRNKYLISDLFITTVVLASMIGCSSCSKPSEELLNQTVQKEGTAQFDLRNFPGNCRLDIKSNLTKEEWHLTTDSLRYYDLVLPTGTFYLKWTMFNTPEERGRKAKIVNHSHGTTMDWGNNTSTIHNWELVGTHTFTKQ